MKKITKSLFVAIALSFLMVSCCNSVQDQTPVDDEEESVVGLDVSHHNGEVDFERRKKGRNVEFVFIKITEGVHFIDSLADHHYRKAKEAGLYVGFYHYFRPQRSGKKQFLFMKAQLDKYDYDLIPVIDVESKNCDWKHPDAYKNLDEFMESFYKCYGYYPILYTIYKTIFDRYPQCITWGAINAKRRKDIRQRVYKNIDIDYCDDLYSIAIPNDVE